MATTTNPTNYTTAHTLSGVGYELLVQVADTWDADTWRVVYAGMVRPGTAPVVENVTQVEALAAATNHVLADLSAETGTPEGSVVVAP